MSETLSFDVIIVGAGPSGLTAAIKIKQICQQKGQDLRVCVLEKGAEVGAHILSGNVLDKCALDELLPEWKDLNAPVTNRVVKDQFMFLTEHKAFRIPTPPQMDNHGNYIISLANFCRWLATQAENLGVEIYSGFAVDHCLFDQNNQVIGVETKATGLDKNYQLMDRYEPGLQIMARHTLLGEGCRGSLTRQLIDKYHLTQY